MVWVGVRHRGDGLRGQEHGFGGRVGAHKTQNNGVKAGRAGRHSASAGIQRHGRARRTVHALEAASEGGDRRVGEKQRAHAHQGRRGGQRGAGGRGAVQLAQQRAAGAEVAKVVRHRHRDGSGTHKHGRAGNLRGRHQAARHGHGAEAAGHGVQRALRARNNHRHQIAGGGRTRRDAHDGKGRRKRQRRVRRRRRPLARHNGHPSVADRGRRS